MQLSEDRISTIAHQIVNEIRRKKRADFCDDSRALGRVKQSLESFFGAAGEIEDAVRAKLRNKAPGSRDYDVLYQKFYHDEMVRRGL